MVRRWDSGLDSIVADCRAVTGKKMLDAELASQIIAAIRLGVETDEWALLKADYPNASVIGCIPRLLREYQDKSAASDDWAEHAERSQAALAERQAAAAGEQRDPWWDGVLGELKLQMTKPTFDTWLKDTTARREGARIVVGVANEQAKDWLDARLRPVIERTVAADGVTDVAFEVI